MEGTEIHAEAEVSVEATQGRGRGYHGRGARGYPRGPRGAKRYVPKGQGGEEQKHGDGDTNAEGEEGTHHEYYEHGGRGKGYRQYHQGHRGYGGRGGGGYRGQQSHGGYGRGRGQATEGPPDDFQNYWKYHNEERKPTVELPKPDEMTGETEIPALPKEAPKKPVDEDFEKLKEEVEKKILEADEEIKNEIRNLRSLEKGLYDAPSTNDTEEIKQMKERMVKLREEKKKQHDKASELKTKISAYNEKINVITAPRDKLPKQIQQYWTLDKAQKRLKELENAQEQGNLKKAEESKAIAEIELLTQYMGSLPKIKNVENELKELYDKRKVYKTENEAIFAKITGLKKEIDTINQKISECYAKIDKQNPEEEREKLSEHIEDLKKKKRALVEEKRKVDDDYYGAWIQFESKMIEFDMLTRLHKIKGAINRRNAYYDQRAKEIKEREYETQSAYQLENCEQAIQYLEAEMFMSGKDASKTKEESKGEQAEIVAPKGFSTIKSKEERFEDELLLQPSKVPGQKKIKKNKAKKLAQVHQGSQKTAASHQREFKLNTLLGALEVDPPEDASQYQEKLDELKKMREELEKKAKEEVQEKKEAALAELEAQRKEEQEARDRGERPRGGRGRGKGDYRGGRGGGRGGGGRGNFRGGRGGGYKGRRYSDDEDEEEETRDYEKQKKPREKQYYQNTEEGNWPELGASVE